tara:strand:+ start:1199 stop:1612 length:414 start_codon:yes stop_codon:yes gene_type:complete
MAFILSLDFNIVINVSVQVGDTAYYTPIDVVGSTNDAHNTAAVVNTISLGKITEIINPDLFDSGISTINIFCDLVDGSNVPLPIAFPPLNSFIMFSKDKKVNTNDLLGYYAEVKFVNDSTEKIEMFQVGAEIQESSK